MKVRMRTTVLGRAVGACALVAALGLGGCSLTTPTLAEAERDTVEQTVDDSLLVQAGTLTVAVDTADAPQAMMNAGEPDGYAVDVARALAARMGLDVAIIDAASPADPLSSHEADLFLGAPAGTGDDAVDVSGDYLENATAVFGTGDTVTAETLAQAIVGVQDGSASQEVLTRSGINANQQTYHNVNECFDALAAGEVSYVVCDATAGAYLARAYPGVRFAGTLSAVDVYGLAVSASAGALGDEILAAFDELTVDGTLDAIHGAWYGTMPFSLSDQVVSGVTVVDTEADAASGDAEGGDAGATGGTAEGTVGEDINSLSD